MPTVIHTGEGLYPATSLGFDAAGFMKQAMQEDLQMEQYRQQLYEKREQDFLAMTSVNTDNLIFSQFQAKAKDELDKFIGDATDMFKSGKGYLSTTQKLDILKKRQEVQMDVAKMQAKAKMYTDRMEIFQKDGGQNYNIDDTMSAFNKFIKDPVNEDVPELVANYVNPIQRVNELADKSYDWGMPTDIGQKKIGDSWVTFKTKSRLGIPDETTAKKILGLMVKDDVQLRRSYNRLYLQNGKSFDDFYNDTKDILIPQVSASYAGQGGLNLGLESSGTLNFSTVDTNNPQMGMSLSVTGNLPKMNFFTGSKSVSGVLRSIDESGIHYDVSYPGGIADKSQAGVSVSVDLPKGKDESASQYKDRVYNAEMSLAAAKMGTQQNNIIKGDDGKWYRKITVKQETISDPQEVQTNLISIKKQIPQKYQSDYNSVFNQWEKSRYTQGEYEFVVNGKTGTATYQDIVKAAGNLNMTVADYMKKYKIKKK